MRTTMKLKAFKGRVGPARPAAALTASKPITTRASCTSRTQVIVHASSDTAEGADRDNMSGFHPHMSIPTTGMAGGLGSSGSGALMEKSKMSLQQQQKSQAPRLDEGGGGGDIGNKIFNGGGGDGDDGDDDDYFNEDGDGEEGDEGKWWHKVPLKQLYDAATVRAVLSEWCMTVETLPGFLQMLASMQYYSTAQWVRYLTMQERPNMFRTIERGLSRFTDARSGFVGRMLADPAFMQKTAIEGGVAFTLAMAHECHVRGKRIKDEMDFALANAVCLAIGASVCSVLVAPSKTPTAPSNKFPWQEMLNKLPNNAFERNTPARSFEIPQRVSGFVAKGVELSAVNAIAGAASAGLQHCALAARKAQDPKYKPVTPVPGISRAAGGLGVYGGLASNTRLQIGAGLDQVLLEYAKVNTTWQVIGLSSAYRAVTMALLENPWSIGPAPVVACSRPALQGAPTQHVPTPMKKTVRRVRKLVRRKRTPEELGETGFQMSVARAPATAAA